MGIIIGGSGSSGTTLLKTIVDRHPDLFSGPELSVFNKERLYLNWNRFKEKLVPPAANFSTDGWFPYPDNNLLHHDYGWEKKCLTGLIAESESLMDFAERFFENSLRRKNAKIWVEKTPSNTYGFSHFLEQSSTNKVVHMLRDPYDTVASLVKRGMSPYFAAGLWVYNNSAGLSVSHRGGSRYYQLRYESLVSNTENEIKQLCDFIGVDISGMSLLEARKDEKNSGIDSWNSKPSEGVSKKSIGGFQRLPVATQDAVISALGCFRIRTSVVRDKKYHHSSSEEICDTLGYRFINPKKVQRLDRQLEMAQDFVRRALKGYSTGGLRYPGALSFR